jgi:hypothetical protein
MRCKLVAQPVGKGDEHLSYVATHSFLAPLRWMNESFPSLGPYPAGIFSSFTAASLPCFSCWTQLALRCASLLPKGKRGKGVRIFSERSRSYGNDMGNFAELKIVQQTRFLRGATPHSEAEIARGTGWSLSARPTQSSGEACFPPKALPRLSAGCSPLVPLLTYGPSGNSSISKQTHS